MVGVGSREEGENGERKRESVMERDREMEGPRETLRETDGRGRAE